MSRLRTQSTVTAGGETVEIEPVTKTVVADVQGAKLKALLGNLKK
jgi:hypothetical protein